MSYMALYRKFRPQQFEDVKGQEHIVTTLKNQVKTGRIGHAYLFCGTRGTGKTTIAKIFAKAVNCENPVDGSPCGECEACKKIAAGASMNVIEIDAASNNSVDNIREIVEEIAYSPAEGKKKVYIIDEAHMLTPSAFNALLKTLEEPPEYAMFILATTEPHKILVTIHSRCQRYDFRRINIDTIADRIKELTAKENVEIEEQAVRYIAKTADGSMRDALSLLDQCIAFHYGEVLTYDKALDVLGAVDSSVFSELLDAVLDRRIMDAIYVLDDVVSQGRELNQFVNDFIWYLRNLMMVKSTETAPDSLEVSSETMERLKEEAQRLELGVIMRYIRIFSELFNQIKYSSQKRILIEVAIIKLCKPQMEETKDSLLDRVRDLEYKIQNGVFVQAEGSAPEGSVTAPARRQAQKVEYPKAVSEEIKKIALGWDSIKEALDNPMKTHLHNCVPSCGGENTLIIATDRFEAYDYLTRVENHDSLKQYLEEFLGKEIVVDIREADDANQLDDQFPDLTKMFNGMPVEVDDEE